MGDSKKRNETKRNETKREGSLASININDQSEDDHTIDRTQRVAEKQKKERGRERKREKERERERDR